MSNEKAKKYLCNLTNEAMDYAKELKSKYVLLEHLLYVYIKQDSIRELFKGYNIRIDKIISETEKHIKTYPLIEYNNTEMEPILSPAIHLYFYYYLGSIQCNLNIKDENIMNDIVGLSSFLMMEGTYAETILYKHKITEVVMTDIYAKNTNQQAFEEQMRPIIRSLTGDMPQRARPGTALEKYAKNLSDIVHNKDWVHIVGRNNEIELAQQILKRKDKPNIILVGDDGIGKKKIVEGLANILLEHKIYQLDMLSLMANVFVKGELENRIKMIGEDLEAEPNSILFIENIDNLCSGQDSSGGGDVASLLKPIINDSNVRIIGTTTFENYRKHMEKDTSFIDLFYRMNVKEPTKDEVKDILYYVSSSYEKYFGIQYQKDALKLIIELCEKYVFDKHFPEKAIDTMDMVGAYCKHNKLKIADKNVVYTTISTMLNIPLSNLSQSEEDIYKNLEQTLNRTIIGQEEAVKKVADAVIVSKSGLRESNKTAISLIFLGKPACGKTQLVKDLAKTMNIPLVRFDMSEYMEENSVSKLIGAPPGYKDAGNGKAGNGLLINAIDEHPYCVLLLDEIEKANSKIHNLLLQVMDNGKLTSSMGKQVSFENVFLIMTSNVGAKNMDKTMIGFGNHDEKPCNADYEMSFLPEFRSRIDSAISFNDLNKEVLIKICNKFLMELKEMLNIKNIDLTYDDNVLEYIVNESGTTEGARPLKHYITNNIKNIIAKNIVFGTYREGNTIKLQINNDKLDFEYCGK